MIEELQHTNPTAPEANLRPLLNHGHSTSQGLQQVFKTPTSQAKSSLNSTRTCLSRCALLTYLPTSRWTSNTPLLDIAMIFTLQTKGRRNMFQARVVTRNCVGMNGPSATLMVASSIFKRMPLKIHMGGQLELVRENDLNSHNPSSEREPSPQFWHTSG